MQPSTNDIWSSALLTAALLRAEAALPPSVDFASLLLPHRRPLLPGFSCVS